MSKYLLLILLIAFPLPEVKCQEAAQQSRDAKPVSALSFMKKDGTLQSKEGSRICLIADDALDYNSELKLFGKEIGNDFYESKITLPIILLYQKANQEEKKKIKQFFEKKERSENEFNHILILIKKYNIINECYRKAEHFINLASNSLSIFKESREKEILKNLTSFSLERSF